MLLRKSVQQEGGTSSKKTATMTRPFRSLPPTYSPSLFFSHGKKFRDQTFCTIFDESYHAKTIPEMRGMASFGSYYGWLLLQAQTSTECHLFNPVSLEKINLPDVPHDKYPFGLLTSDPRNPDCSVILFSPIQTSLIICRIGDTKWIEQNLESEKKQTELTEGPYNSLVFCKGKAYLFSSYGIIVIDIHDTPASVEMYKKKHLEKSLPEAYFCKDHFLESCGEIFLARLIYLGNSINIIRTWDVFKLDISTMDWVAVESIGDRIFLVDCQGSTSLSATELQTKGNCIYFTDTTTSFYRFDMENGTITSNLRCPKAALPHWEGPYWVVPDCKMLKVSRISAPKGEGEGEVMEVRSWNNLPEELLELILSSLFGADVIRFRLTCKTWKHVPQQVRPNPKLDNLPWLISLPRMNKDVCNLYHPLYSDAYIMNSPKLAGAIIRDAKYGWMLMSQGCYKIFFYNPLTTETINLPDVEVGFGYDFACISFSAPPTSSECMVFGLTRAVPKMVDMLIYKIPGDDVEIDDEDAKWSYKCVKNKEPYEFMSCDSCNPVFYNGVFYCLSRDGKLGCFDPKETGGDGQPWRVLPVPPVLNNTAYELTRSFMVEYNGDIFSVFVDHIWGKKIQVNKLDLTEMKWVRIQSLGNNVVFLSPTRSLMVPAHLKGTKNRIYFPKFCGQDIMYYSLSTGQYHCFGADSWRGDWTGSCEHWNCSWFEFTEQNRTPSPRFEFTDENSCVPSPQLSTTM